MDVVNDPTDWKNWAALGVDLVFMAIPFVPGGSGQVIKAGNRLDDAVDVANAINKIDNIHDLSRVTFIGRNMERVEDVASLLNRTDNLYDAWRGYDNAAKGMKNK